MTATWQIGSAHAHYNSFPVDAGSNYVSSRALEKSQLSTAYSGSISSTGRPFVASLSTRKFATFTPGDAKAVVNGLQSSASEYNDAFSPYTSRSNLQHSTAADARPLRPRAGQLGRINSLDRGMSLSPRRSVTAPNISTTANSTVLDHRFRIPSTAEIRACAPATGMDAQRFDSHDAEFRNTMPANTYYVRNPSVPTLQRSNTFHSGQQMSPLKAPMAALPYHHQIARTNETPNATAQCWNANTSPTHISNGEGEFSQPNTRVSSATSDAAVQTSVSATSNDRPMYWLYGFQGKPAILGHSLYARAKANAMNSSSVATSGVHMPHNRTRSLDDTTDGGRCLADQSVTPWHAQPLSTEQSYVSTLRVTSPRNAGSAQHSQSTKLISMDGTGHTYSISNKPCTNTNGSAFKSILKKGSSQPAKWRYTSLNFDPRLPNLSAHTLVRRTSTKRVTFQV